MLQFSLLMWKKWRKWLAPLWSFNRCKLIFSSLSIKTWRCALLQKLHSVLFLGQESSLVCKGTCENNALTAILINKSIRECKSVNDVFKPASVSCFVVVAFYTSCFVVSLIFQWTTGLNDFNTISLLLSNIRGRTARYLFRRFPSSMRE